MAGVRNSVLVREEARRGPPLAATHRKLPGPRGGWLVGNLADYESDRLGWLIAARDTFGELVRFDDTTTVVNGPDLAKVVLSDREQAFAIKQDLLQRTIPDHDITSWVTARRVLNPALRRSLAARSASQVRAATLAAASRARAGGEPVAAMELLEEVCSVSIASYFFGTEHGDIPTSSARLLEALGAVIGNPFATPASWPTPARRRIQHRMADLEAATRPLLAARLSALDRYDDAAAHLLRAAKARPGVSITRLNRILIGALLAAHRVPAAAIAWTLMRATSPNAHLDALRTDASTFEAMTLGRQAFDLAQLGTTIAFVKEALRLHPPTWLLTRTLIAPATLGGVSFPVGHTLLISPYVIHRDPSEWAQPDEFLVDRWLDQRPGGVYLPFGGGPRACPGNDLALVMIVSTLLTLLRHYDVKALNDDVTANPRTTLLPVGLRLRLSPLK
jgi:unspecific monooxygenase